MHITILVLPLNLGGIDVWMVIAKLQEALYSGTRVFRALSIVTMWETTATLQPLAFSSCNELIDDALGVVSKIAKLCLPNGQ
jgi:hypothetical protein